MKTGALPSTRTPVANDWYSGGARFRDMLVDWSVRKPEMGLLTQSPVCAQVSWCDVLTQPPGLGQQADYNQRLESDLKKLLQIKCFKTVCLKHSQRVWGQIRCENTGIMVRSQPIDHDPFS